MLHGHGQILVRFPEQGRAFRDALLQFLGPGMHLGEEKRIVEAHGHLFRQGFQKDGVLVEIAACGCRQAQDADGFPAGPQGQRRKGGGPGLPVSGPGGPAGIRPEVGQVERMAFLEREGAEMPALGRIGHGNRRGISRPLGGGRQPELIVLPQVEQGEIGGRGGDGLIHRGLHPGREVHGRVEGGAAGVQGGEFGGAVPQGFQGSPVLGEIIPEADGAGHPARRVPQQGVEPADVPVLARPGEDLVLELLGNRAGLEAAGEHGLDLGPQLPRKEELEPVPAQDGFAGPAGEPDQVVVASGDEGAGVEGDADQFHIGEGVLEAPLGFLEFLPRFQGFERVPEVGGQLLQEQGFLGTDGLGIGMVDHQRPDGGRSPANGERAAGLKTVRQGRLPPGQEIGIAQARLADHGAVLAEGRAGGAAAFRAVVPAEVDGVQVPLRQPGGTFGDHLSRGLILETRPGHPEARLLNEDPAGGLDQRGAVRAADEGVVHVEQGAVEAAPLPQALLGLLAVLHGGGQGQGGHGQGAEKALLHEQGEGGRAFQGKGTGPCQGAPGGHGGEQGHQHCGIEGPHPHGGQHQQRQQDEGAVRRVGADFEPEQRHERTGQQGLQMGAPGQGGQLRP